MSVARSNRKQNMREAYLRGTTAYAYDVKRAEKEAPTGEPLRVIRNEKRKAERMNMGLGFALAMIIATVAIGYGLVSYIGLQSDISTSMERIAGYEQTLNNLTLANDDEYSKMNNAVDYDAIRKIAIEELGMVYAAEDQIVSYSREHSDYVRQLNGLSD